MGRKATSVVRPSWIFASIFAVVGAAMVVERIATGDGQLVAGLIMMAAGSTYLFNKVEISQGQAHIQTPRRQAVVRSPQRIPGSRQHILDAESGERHQLPIGIWIEDIEKALDETMPKAGGGT